MNRYHALLAAALLSITAAHADPRRDYMQAQWLANLCGWSDRAATGTAEACTMRVTGDVEGVVAAASLSKGKLAICKPPETYRQERIAVVKKYFEDHPESMSAEEGTVVAAALAHAWPCPTVHGR